MESIKIVELLTANLEQSIRTTELLETLLVKSFPELAEKPKKEPSK